MKKFLIYTLWPQLLFITAIAGQAAAQNATTLSPVVVTTNRWEEPVSQEPERVTTISKDEIELIPVRDAGDTINYMPGVIIEKGGAGGPGGVVFPMIQGASYAQTSVLINGIPLNDLSNGLGNIGQIPAALIDRVEVVHGPAGSKWGSAIGGIINVITQKADRNARSWVQGGGGENGTSTAATGLQVSSDALALGLGGAYRNSSGREGGKQSDNNASGLADFEANLGSKTQINALAYNFQGESSSGVYKDQFAGYWEKYKYNTTGGGATLQQDFGVGALRITGYLQAQTSTTNGNMVDTQISETKLEDSVKGGYAVWRSVIDSTIITAGGDIKNGELKNNGLIQDKYTVNINGLFGTLQQVVGNTVLEAGVRQSNEDYYGAFTGYTFGALYRIDSLPMELRATVSKGYAAPGLASRFLEISQVFRSNPDMTVEKVMTYQAGVRSALGAGVTVDIAGFYSDVSDAIGVSFDDAAQLYYYKNFAKWDIRGVEGEVRWAAGDSFTLFVNTLQQTIKDVSTGNIVEDKVRASYAFGAAVNAGGLLLSANGTWKDYNLSQRSQGKDKIFVVDAKAAYNWKLADKSALSLFVNVFNLTDAQYYTNFMLPTNVPRQFEGGVKYYF